MSFNNNWFKQSNKFNNSIVLLFLIISSCSTSKSYDKSNIKNFEIGYFSTINLIGGHGYEFLNDKKVIYNWHSSLFSFNRKGIYKIKNDTIEIEFEPMTILKNKRVNLDETIIQIKKFNGNNFIDFPVEIFRKGIKKLEKTDSSGIININGPIENIDSIYFNWQFEEFGIYPIETKYDPKHRKVEGEFLKGFVNLEVLIDEDLIGQPIQSNFCKLLIIGNNELFEGTNYDPNVIYLGGILKKE